MNIFTRIMRSPNEFNVQSCTLTIPILKCERLVKLGDTIILLSVNKKGQYFMDGKIRVVRVIDSPFPDGIQELLPSYHILNHPPFLKRDGTLIYGANSNNWGIMTWAQIPVEIKGFKQHWSTLVNPDRLLVKTNNLHYITWLEDATHYECFEHELRYLKNADIREATRQGTRQVG